MHSDRLGELECISRGRELTPEESGEMERIIVNQRRATHRRHLYRTDPLWRLSKLKDCRERRLRRARA